MILANPLIEALPETRQSGLRLKSFRKSCVDFHWHFHPEIELIYVKEGSGVRYVGRSVEPFSPGDFCLIGSNVPHAFGSSPAERRGAAWIVGHFRPEVWGAAFWKLPETRRIVGLFADAQKGIKWGARESRECLVMFERIEKLRPGTARMAAWLEILDRLARLRGQKFLNAGPPSEAQGDARLQKVLGWVESNASDPTLSQAQAAREITMTPQAFCRFFRMGTGRTFQRYVNEVRTARACGALLHSGTGISEIAFQSGFNNLANFNRRFREIAGCTPRDYRKSEGGIRAPSDS